MKWSLTSRKRGLLLLLNLEWFVFYFTTCLVMALSRDKTALRSRSNIDQYGAEGSWSSDFTGNPS
jgi:hypothetical protein